MESMIGLAVVLGGLAAVAALQAQRVSRLMWSVEVLNRRLGLIAHRLKAEDGLASWQRLALDPSSSRLAVPRAYMAETGSGLREANDAFERWRG